MSPDNRLAPETKADIQGFITSAFGHLPLTAYLFLEIGDRPQAQQWLKRLLPSLATAASWRPVLDAPKLKPERALNLALTYSGLGALGMRETVLHTFPAEFCEGMAAPERSRVLGDSGESAPAQWELGGPQNPMIHIILILNAQTRADLDAGCSELRQTLKDTHGGVVEHESSAQYGVRPDYDREPFGFFDGIAQPQIEGIKGKGVRTGEFILGYPNEYGFHPLSPVVPAAADPAHILPESANPFHKPAGYRDLGLNGTYIVYRKLEQDVAGFWRFLQGESLRLKGAVDPSLMVWLAAKMVGRWPSGAPLVLAPDRDGSVLPTDDFLYARMDPQGLACPLGAHIRRTNPRDQIGPAGPVESLHMSARHRIMRRGRAYGAPLFDPTALTRPDQPAALQAILDLQDDGQSRGIHFLCVNTNLKSQFEFIQQAWANNPHFGGLTDNRDPLIGDNDPSTAPGGMLIPGDHSTIRTASLPRFVTVRGGAYLFMPGLTALRYLAEPH
jgi:Dyp-type peroxidase family